VRVGDIVTVKDKTVKNVHVDGAWQTAAGRGRPSWIAPGEKDLSVSVVSMPTRQDIDSNINEQLIVELYSK
jgi:small subunit ribosomal protein S4